VKALGKERFSIAAPQEQRALAGGILPSSLPNNAHWHVVLILQSTRPGAVTSNENLAMTHGKSRIEHNVNNRVCILSFGGESE
jgi:hypothetical protein